MGERHLRTDHLLRDLPSRSVRGGAITLAAQAAKLVLNLATAVILARLLSPGEFGLVAMSTALVYFLLPAIDLGLPAATVQRERIDHDQVSTLFWTNLGAGVVVAAAVTGCAPLLAAFYGEPMLARVTPALAAGLVLAGAGAQHHAILRRQMRYGAVSAVETVALVAGLGAGAAFAARGAGVWSLVAMHVAIHLTSTVGAWVVCRWRPGRPGPVSAVRDLLGFGGRLTGFRVVNYLARNADDVLIGRFAGAAMLGLYTKAYKLLLVPVREIGGPASSVVVAGLSRLQDDPARFRQYYVRAVLVVAAAGMPVVAFMCLAADNVVALLLGDAWSGCVPLFRILAPAAFVGTFHAAGSWACTALGRAGRMLRWQLIASAVTVAAFGIGIRWGAEGVAAACSVAAVGLRYPALSYLLAGAPVGPRHVTAALWRPAVASVGAALVVGVAMTAGLGGDGPTALALLALSYLACYAGAWMLLPGGAHLVAEGVAALRAAGFGGESTGVSDPPALS